MTTCGAAAVKRGVDGAICVWIGRRLMARCPQGPATAAGWSARVECWGRPRHRCALRSGGRADCYKRPASREAWHGRPIRPGGPSHGDRRTRGRQPRSVRQRCVGAAAEPWAEAQPQLSHGRALARWRAVHRSVLEPQLTVGSLDNRERETVGAVDRKVLIVPVERSGRIVKHRAAGGQIPRIRVAQKVSLNSSCRCWTKNRWSRSSTRPPT